jgi:hypothetical protein
MRPSSTPVDTPRRTLLIYRDNGPIRYSQKLFFESVGPHLILSHQSPTPDVPAPHHLRGSCEHPGRGEFHDQGNTNYALRAAYPLTAL